jgi:hypothetical protein
MDEILAVGGMIGRGAKLNDRNKNAGRFIDRIV